MRSAALRNVSAPPRLVYASTFDGTNDYLTRGADLTGISDGKAGTISMWLRSDFDVVTSARLWETDDTGGFRGIVTSVEAIQIIGENAAGTTILSGLTSTVDLNDGNWHHLVASWNLAAAGSGQIYVDDAADGSFTTYTDDAIDYTRGNFAIGAFPGGVGKYNGDMAEVWFTTTRIDLSVEANRRKLITEAGKPADLGPDGSRPTGSKPIIYLRHPASQFGTNSGAGGNFTINGALTAATTRP